MFELPSRRDVSKCVITKETIEKGLKPTLVTSAEGVDDDDAAADRRIRLRRPVRSGGRTTLELPPYGVRPEDLSGRDTA